MITGFVAGNYGGFGKAVPLFSGERFSGGNVVFSQPRAFGPYCGMYRYSMQYRTLRAFFKCLLLVSSLVLFGNRLTDRFHLCTSMSGGLYRVMQHSHHPHAAQWYAGAHYAKVLLSVDKRYRGPLGMGPAEPFFCIVGYRAPGVFAGYLAPGAPPLGIVSCLFLRGPPAGVVLLA